MIPSTPQCKVLSSGNKLIQGIMYIIAILCWSTSSLQAQTGGALNFTNGDYVQLGASFNGLNFGTGDFTLETWFRTSMSDGAIMSKRSICNVSAFWNVRISNGQIRFEMMEANGSKTVDISTPLAYNDNQWHHLAVVRDGIIMQIIMDGYLVVNTPFVNITNLNNVTDPIKLGQSACSNYIGELDETRIWSIARTVCEIFDSKRYEFNSTSTSLKFNAHFNQGIAGGNNAAVTTVTNSASNGITGALNTFALTGTTSNWVNSSCPAQGFTSIPVSVTTVTACASYTWGGTTYTNSGTYLKTFNVSVGCDSDAQLNLTIKNNPTYSVVTGSNSLCSGQSTTMTLSNSSQLSYCTPTTTGNTASSDFITLFQLGGISKNSGEGPGVYNFYSSEFAQVTAGSTYSYIIAINSTNPQGTAIWIDCNQDGDFNDANEYVASSPSSLFGPFASLTIPSSAHNGHTRMRVACRRNAAPAANQSCGGFDFGEFEDYNIIINGGVVGSNTYTWSPTTFLSSSTGAIVTASNVSSSTTYTITGTDANGCTGTVTKSITVNPLPAAPFISSPSASYCSGTTMNLVHAPTYCTPTVSGSNVAGQHFIASFALGSNLISNLSGDGPGVYNHYTSQTANIQVGVGYAFVLVPGGTIATSKAIWLDLNHDGDFSDANELIVSAATSLSNFSGFINIPSSAYNGLTRMRIAVSTNSTINSGQSCSGFTFGEYEDYNVQITGGDDAFTWAPSAPLNTSSGSPVQITNQTANTTYTLTITDANGCTQTNTKTISFLAAPHVTISASADSICNGNALTLTASGASSYVWSNSISNGVAFTPTATNTYTVTGTGANGCTDIATKEVKVLAVPTAPTISGPNSVCPGGKVLLSTNNYCIPVNQPNNSYSNSYSAAQVIFGSAIVNNTVTNVQINNAINLNSVYSDFTDQIANVTAGGMAAVVVIPEGSQPVYFVALIDYDQNGVFDVQGNEVVLAVQTPMSNPSGANFQIPTTAKNGLTRMRILVSSHNFNLDVACFNHDPNGAAQAYGEYEDYTIKITGGVNSNFTWSPTQSVTNTQGASTIATINSSTTYTVTNTSANGCTASSTKLVTALPAPTVNVTASVPGVCIGNPVTLTATGASSYSWSNSVSNGVPFSPTTTTTYSVVGTNASGCKDTATIQIPVETAPTIPTINGNNVCNGQAATLSLGGSGGSNTYVWSPSNVLVNTTGSTITTVPLTVTTTFTVTATSTYGCTATATKTIIVNPLPVFSATSSASGICPGDTVQLGVTPVPSIGSFVSWSPAQGLSNPNIYNPKASPSIGVIYFVTITDSNGCTGLSGVSIAVNSIPNTILVGGPNAICTGSSATLIASGASSYSWQPGNLNGASINVSPTQSTTYTVTASNSFGCTKTATKLVTVNPIPAPVVLTSSNTICTGTTVNLQPSITSAVGPSIAIVDDAPANPYPASINLNGLPSSNVQLNRVYINGLSHTFPDDIDIWLKAPNGQIVMLMSDAGGNFDLLNVDLIFKDGQPNLPDANLITSGTYQPTNYGVNGSNEPTNPSTLLSFFNGNMNGTWELYVRDDVSGDAGSIASFQLEFGNSDTTNLSIAWVANPTSNQSSISNPSSFSTTVSPTTSTMYTATVTDAIGCTGTTSVSITVNPCNTDLSLKLFIEGFYLNAQTMQAVKMNQGIGNSSVDVDAITVELRESTIPYNLVATTTADLKTNGTAIATFNNAYNGNYYIVIKYRNSLQTWSAAPVSISTNSTYDFSTAANKAYGDNQVEVETGVWALLSGDMNQDEAVDAFDYLVQDPDIINGSFGYLATDLNGDGAVDAFDFLTMEVNLINGAGTSKP